MHSGPGGRGSDARCLSHWAEATCLVHLGRQISSPFTRVMPCHTQSDTTIRSHTTAIPHSEEKAWPRADQRYTHAMLCPCHAHAMPAPPLLSPRLPAWYFPGSHITIAQTLPHDIAPSPPNSAKRLTERLANSCQPSPSRDPLKGSRPSLSPGLKGCYCNPRARAPSSPFPIS